MIAEYLKQSLSDADTKRLLIKSDATEKIKSEKAIVHYISTPHIDRARDILIPKGMDDKEFSLAPSVWYNHNYKSDPNAMPIAKSLWRKKQEDGVLTKTAYASTQMANDDYLLHTEGFIETWSVGLSPVKDKSGFIEKDSIAFDEKANTAIWHKWKLLEYSSAPLACNVYATDKIKALAEIEFESLEFRTFAKNTVLEAELYSQLAEVKEELAKLKTLYDLVESLNQKSESDKIEIMKLIENSQSLINKNISIELPANKLTNDRVKDIVKSIVSGGK